jgi:hypothetical protein
MPWGNNIFLLSCRITSPSAIYIRYMIIFIAIFDRTMKLFFVRHVFSLTHCTEIKFYPNLIIIMPQNFEISRQIESMFRPFSADYSSISVEACVFQITILCPHGKSRHVNAPRGRDICTFGRGNGKSLFWVSEPETSEHGTGHVWAYRSREISGCRQCETQQ